jgi:hypothetical protein
VSTDYSDHYSWHGWDSGDDVDPPEPGKQWLTITEDGEEYAIIVLRTNASTLVGHPDAVFKREAQLEERATRIVAALNAYREDVVVA